ncbi:MAG: TonB-dependent receptor, partial [Chitinophagaceae bacterium]|nr:TonB-dependent receptor [Chitinophagaceae bacterium]
LWCMLRIALFLILLLHLCFCSSGQELPLYNGSEYTGFYHGVNGHPFYKSDSLLDADVFYDGVLYKNLRIGFNLADNAIYIKEPGLGYAIQLVNDKIAYFIIGSSKFINVRQPGEPVFYEVIYKDGIKVYVLRQKQLKQAFRPEDPMKFVEYTSYFVARGGKLVKVKSLNAVNASMKTDSLMNSQLVLNDTIQSSPLSRKYFEENQVHEIGNENKEVKKNLISLGGYVTDAKTGESVIGISVAVDSSTASVTTDQFGFYSINLPPGKHTINFSGAGINPARRTIILNEDGRLNLSVTAQVNSLKTVVVTAEKNSKIKSPQMGIEKLNIKTIKQVPVVFGEADVLRVVTTLPGVSTAGEASTGFNVRGGSTDQNLILFNEATIYNPSHLFGFFSAFNPDIIKSVELYKSSIPEKYGGRLSSVLDIVSREGNSKKISGTGGIGPLTSKLTLEGPVSFKPAGENRNPSTTFIASGRATYSDWLLNALPDERYNNSRASFHDINLTLTHSPDKKNSIYLTGYLSNDKFKLNNDTSYKYGNSNINLKWKHVFNNKLYSVVTGGYDKYKYSVTSDNNKVNAFDLDFDINQVHFRTNFTYSPTNNHSIDVGIQTVYYRLHPGSLQPASDESLIEPDVLQQEQALETAIYVGDNYNITSNFTIDAGLRYSVYNFLGPSSVDQYPPGIPKDTAVVTSVYYEKGKVIKTWHAPEFRFAARYLLSEISSLKIAFNTTRQYIHMLSNTTIVSPTDIWKLSDNNIMPQSAYQVSAGYYRNFNQSIIETSFEVYYKRMKNVLDYKSGARLVMNHHIAADVINAEGKSYGAEFMLKKTSGKLNGWVSYTYSRVFLQQNDSLAGERINKGEPYPANFDKPHNLNVIGNYRFTHRFSLSMNIVYTTGRPVTVPVAIFDMGGSQRVFYSERNQYRIPDYFRTDISFTIEGNHKLKQRIHNSWSFGVYNMLARQNPYSVYFKEEGGIVKGYQLSIFGTAIPFVTFNFRF